MAGLGNTPMPDGFPGKRAKIFAPFDALRGFSAAIMAETARAMNEEENASGH